MKIIGCVLFILGGIQGLLAGSSRLEGMEGEHYRPAANVEIVWASTNDLPRGLWVYKVVPQQFPMVVVSNLMSIGGFDWKNLVKPLKSHLDDKNLICFQDKKEIWTRKLEIAPTLGWIEYFAQERSASPKTIELAPSKSEVEQLASDVLLRMGVDSSLLCNKKNGYQTVQGKLSPDGQKLTTNVVGRGISYDRKIDGVKWGGLGFRIDFVGHAKISHFWLEWRNLSPYQLHPTLNQNQIIDSIKCGQSLAPVWEDLGELDKVEKLTVVKMTPYYFDEDISKPMDFTYPYAELQLAADFGNNNTKTFCLDCPIISTNSFSGGK